MTLAAIKRLVQPGQVFDVTNHYLTRVDHPAYGTTRRTVTRVTGSRFYLAYDNGKESYVDWPKAAQVSASPDGSEIALRGAGIGQRPDEPFLTLRRVE